MDGDERVALDSPFGQGQTGTALDPARKQCDFFLQDEAPRCRQKVRPQMVATSWYFAAQGSMILLRPWPGLISSRPLTSPKDSKRETSRFTAFRSLLSVTASSETGAGLSRTACITRTRSAESTLTRSAGSSKVMEISEGSFSPRSIFRARSSDRPTNSSTVPDDTVTRGDTLLLGLAMFFIFLPPKLPDLAIELRGQCLVPGKLERLLLSHEVPVMVAVAVVVAEHPPIIRAADRRVHVCEAVLYDLPFLGLPHLFLQHGSASRPLQIDRIVDDLPKKRSAGPFRPQSPG